MHGFEGLFIVYALLSLTIVRMIPVALSLAGKKLSKTTIIYLGWFGPRGAASILYLLTVLVQYHISKEQLIYQVAAMTIMLSVIFHGLTAAWASDHYPQSIND